MVVACLTDSPNHKRRHVRPPIAPSIKLMIPGDTPACSPTLAIGERLLVGREVARHGCAPLATPRRVSSRRDYALTWRHAPDLSRAWNPLSSSNMVVLRARSA